MKTDKKNRYFIAKFENGNEPFYLAEWTGDPGRTLLNVNAKKFKTKELAEKAIKNATKKYVLRNLNGKAVECYDLNGKVMEL